MNQSELVAKKELEADKWTVFKLDERGIPDFLCVRNGQFKLVESKRLPDKLSPLQISMIKRLKQAGIPVEVFETETSSSFTVSGNIPDDLESKFRQKAVKVFGGRKGSVEKALEQAIAEWVK